MKRYFGGLWAGESDIKSRIKGILKDKKPGFWVIAVTTVGLAVMGALLLSNQYKPNTASRTNRGTFFLLAFQKIALDLPQAYSEL